MIFSNLIRHCTKTKAIFKGRAVHAKLVISGFHPDIYTNNHLLSMHLNSSHVVDARTLFDQMPERNIVSWTTLLSSYSQMGLSIEALDCFRHMVQDGFEPNHYTYVAAISACTSLGAGRTGKEIHGKIFRREEDVNSFVSNCLVNFYGKCGLLISAQVVFDAILEPNSVSWTSLMSCYSKCGENEGALKIFSRALRVGVEVSKFSCASVLGACAVLENFNVGMQVHGHAVKCGVRMDQFVVTALVNFYGKCGALELARKAFWEVDKPHLSAWTALMSGCVQQGNGRDAVHIFCKMHSADLKPNETTFSSALGSFSAVMEIGAGKQLHSLIVKSGFNLFTLVNNALLDFYSKSGLLDESFKTFEEMDEHDTVTWNSLISGLANSGHYQEAVEHLRSMIFKGFDPSLYTYSTILSICGDVSAVEWGKQIHCCIMKPRFDSDVVVGSALVDMYAKCGRLSDARKVFNDLPSKNTVSWNTMLVGYAQHGYGNEALDIFDLMQRDGVKPNDITFVGVLSACVHGGLLEEGLHYFNSMTKDYGIAPRTDHLACMVSLFTRKGQTTQAYHFIMNSQVEPDKVVWRCLLSGCITRKDLDLGKLSAERILSIDQDDTSAHVMLSNIYAESRMWNELAEVRKLMKEKELKKDTGYSWTELQNKIYSFPSGYNVHFQGNSMHESLSGLTAQLFDAGYVFSLLYEE